MELYFIRKEEDPEMADRRIQVRVPIKKLPSAPKNQDASNSGSPGLGLNVILGTTFHVVTSVTNCLIPVGSF